MLLIFFFSGSCGRLRPASNAYRALIFPCSSTHLQGLFIILDKDSALLKRTRALCLSICPQVPLDTHELSHNLSLFSCIVQDIFNITAKMLAKTNTLVLTLLLSAGASAAPACGGGQNGTTQAITPAQIEKIAPKSTSCDNAKQKDECATSDVAARAIAASFERYQVTSPAEQAAVIGLMAFESDEFQYSRNHYPGVEGQGSMFFRLFVVFLFFFIFLWFYVLIMDSAEHAIPRLQCRVRQVD